MTNSNFLVKVTDAKLTDIRKALQTAGINVRSIIEVFKEEVKSPEEKRNQSDGKESSKKTENQEDGQE